jgi:TRAP-type C4-dicarboxylate transport system permease small subunit
MANLENSPRSDLPASDVSAWVRIVATILRTIFIGLLVVLTFRVAMPQSETLWTIYDTPGDLVRMILGIGVCIWLISQLFWNPRDAHGYRTWLYLGLVAVPFAAICLIAIW